VNKLKVKDIMTVKGLVTVSSTSKVADALAKMKETGIHQVPVLAGKRYAGMLSYRDVLRRRSIQTNARTDRFMVKTTKLSSESDILPAIKLFKDSGLPALPVVDQGKLSGILSRTDILKNIEKIVKPNGIKCLDIMSDDPVVAMDNESVDQALEKIRALDEDEIPVVNGDNKIVGILSVGQLSSSTLFNESKRDGKANYPGGAEKPQIKSGSVTIEPVRVFLDTSIEECAKLMIDSRLHTLPVVDGGDKVIGVVGVTDIINTIDTGGNRGGILIQVSGLGPWDEDLYDMIYFNADKFISRLQKVAGTRSGNFTVHVTKYESGGRIKYSLRTKFFGGTVNMSVSDHDWNFGKCISRIMETYENRLKKRREK
jgi:CBS domain-containing protein